MDIEHFSLVKCDITEKKVHFEASILTETTAENAKTYKDKPTYFEYPTLGIREQLAALKDFYFQYFNFNTVPAVISDPKFAATKPQKDLMIKARRTVLDLIKITGITVAGKDRTGITIHGTVNGCKMVTKSISFDHPQWGNDLKTISDKLEQELVDFAYHGKRDQLQTGDGENEESPVTKPGDKS